jgi:hypothetical protein
LGQHKFKIIYTPGRDNSRADALSQRPDIIGTKKITESTILKVHKDGSLRPTEYINSLVIKVRLDVPKELQEQIIQQHHNDPVHSHPRVARTIELIARNYQFQKIKDKVSNFIKKCADCQKNKHSTHAPYREMQPIELPEKP